MVVGAIIWGAAFVAQSVGAEHVGPFAFGAIRFFLGSLVLVPVMLIMRSRRPKPDAPDAPLSDYLKAGAICGAALFAGASLQQYGLMYSSVGNAGFVTSLYIVLVPLFGFLFFKRRLSLRTVTAVLVATGGVYLLCISSDFSVNRGDLYTMAGSVFWAAQILLLERFSQNLDGIKFALFEFMSCSLLSAAASLFFERTTWAGVAAAAIPLLYCGLLSVGVGFTAQIICVKYTDPIVASLIMSAESPFAALFGWLILGEGMTSRQLIGAALVFAGVVICQLPPRGARPVKPGARKGEGS